MRVAERGVWLSTFAAVLGVAVGSCKKDAPPDPALAVREIAPSASAPVTAAASAPPIEDAAPESSIASNDADASLDASRAKATASGLDASIGLGNIGSIGRINPSCGASVSTY